MRSPGKHPLRKKITVVLRAGLTVLLATPMILAAYRHWLGVQQVIQSMDWLYFWIGLLVLTSAQPLIGLVSWVVLRQLGQAVSYFHTFLVNFGSQAAKYLPGGIWAFPGRILGYQRIGVEPAAAVISLLREESILFIGAALIGLASLPEGLLADDWLRLAILIGGAAGILAILAMQLPGLGRLISKIPYFKDQAPGRSLETTRLNPAWIPIALIISLGFWSLTGIGFSYLITAISPSSAQINLLQAAGIFCLSWCAGYVMILVPSGLGVRETAMTVLMANFLPVADAISLALMARLWWTIGEGIFMVFSLMVMAAHPLKSRVVS